RHQRRTERLGITHAPARQTNETVIDQRSCSAERSASDHIISSRVCPINDGRGAHYTERPLTGKGLASIPVHTVIQIVPGPLLVVLAPYGFGDAAHREAI